MTTAKPFDKLVRIRLREASALSPAAQDLDLDDGHVAVRRGDAAASEALVGAPGTPAVGGAGDSGRVVGLDATGQLDRLTYCRVESAMDLVHGEEINGGGQFGRKANEVQVVNNSTTLVDDSHLLVTLGIGTWHLDAAFSIESNALADFKWDWQFTGTAASFYMNQFLADLVASAVSAHEFTALGSSSSVSTVDGTRTIAQCSGDIVVTAAGIFKLRWAQSTAHASDTKVKTGGYLRATLEAA